jgi:hypothetical protein
MNEPKSEITYWNKDVSASLELGDSTLRKWCIELEKNGYVFLKDDHNNRAFTEHDIIALRTFKEQVQLRNKTLKNAAIAVVSTFKKDRTTYGTGSGTKVVPDGTNPVLEEKMNGNTRSDYVLVKNEDMEQILKSQKQLENFNKELLMRLDKLSDHISNEFKQRDKQVQHLLDQTSETKMLLGAAQEAAANQEQEKPSLMKRIKHVFKPE